MKKDKKSKNFLDKPFYEGGNRALRAFVDKHLAYPESVLQKGINGTVVIRYTINHKGKVINTKVVSSLEQGCDDAAEAVVRKLKFQVGSYRNIKVQFHKTIRIHFRSEVAKKKMTPQKPKPTSGISYSITPSKVARPSPKPKVKAGYSYTIQIPK